MRCPPSLSRCRRGRVPTKRCSSTGLGRPPDEEKIEMTLTKLAAGVLLATFACGTFAADDIPFPPEVLLRHAQKMAVGCPALIQGFLGRADLAPVFEERPMQVQAACAPEKA